MRRPDSVLPRTLVDEVFIYFASAALCSAFPSIPYQFPENSQVGAEEGGDSF